MRISDWSSDVCSSDLPTPEAAHAEGFTDFGPDDICPVSGFVYRLAGFRLEARELVLRMMRVDGRTPEPRVRFHQVAHDDAEARGYLAERSEEHTSELQSLMRISYAVFCLQKKKNK